VASSKRRDGSLLARLQAKTVPDLSAAVSCGLRLTKQRRTCIITSVLFDQRILGSRWESGTAPPLLPRRNRTAIGPSGLRRRGVGWTEARRPVRGVTLDDVSARAGVVERDSVSQRLCCMNDRPRRAVFFYAGPPQACRNSGKAPPLALQSGGGRHSEEAVQKV